MNKVLQVGGVVVLAMVLSACASSSNRVTVQESAKVSKGQELNDLLRARNENAVTASEYEELRAVIMRRPQ
ncbi:MAG: hypothetical protein ACRC2X_17165 [Giesbergeria sp.]|jgi:hypothetical protein|nr:hypothetical protein [Pseudomonadota bacterium]